MPVTLGLIMKGISPEIPAPGKLFDVDGHKMHTNCTGPDNDLPPVVVDRKYITLVTHGAIL